MHRWIGLRTYFVAALGLTSACMQPIDTTVGDGNNTTSQAGAPANNSNIAQGATKNPNNAANNNDKGPSQNTNTMSQDHETAVPKPNPGPSPRFMARIDTVTDANGPIIAWPGSQIILGFFGTQLAVNLSELDRSAYGGNNYFSVVTDGNVQSRIKLSRTAASYVVATGLAAGQHQVVLTKLTEAQIGRVQFTGYKTDGQLTSTTPVPQRRLEFVGDSGSAGYGAGGVSPCQFSEATEDASVAYPNVVAQLLSADVHNLSFSGKGIVANRDMVSDSYKTLPVLWQRTLPNDEDMTPYDPNGWLPQAVIMTIGGNDFYNVVPDQISFTVKLSAFIKSVQSLYSGVHVYVGISPMLRNDSHPNQRETAIGYVQDAVKNFGDSRVHYLTLPPDLGANGYGCDEHMTPATHKMTADAVVAALRAQFGW